MNLVMFRFKNSKIYFKLLIFEGQLKGKIFNYIVEIIISDKLEINCLSKILIIIG